jgi:hypothetical protein
MPKILWKYHGPQYMQERHIWLGMKNRCHNPKNPAYPRYGGRGIFVCDEWVNDFDKFYEDMGPRPKGLALDRIDNNKGYSKENCRWVTYKENNRNTRRTVFVELDGQKLKMHELVEKTGQKSQTILYRIKKGMSVEKIMSVDKLPNAEKKFPPRHGTYYEYQKWGCRCEPCKQAASIYKSYRHQQRKLARQSKAVV